jgi:hypothetical protein
MGLGKVRLKLSLAINEETMRLSCQTAVHVDVVTQPLLNLFGENFQLASSIPA